MAVFSNRDDVDPVGACVGLKGVRIQAVIREIEGEKIDVLKYDEDPRVFIRNALSPAEVNEVVIMDEAKRSALAVVSEPQFSLAIGKQGLNVRLANRLADWSIDVKTDEQFAEMDITADSRKAANDLFSDEVFVDEIFYRRRGITEEIAALLSQGNILKIGDLLALGEEQLSAISGITEEHITLLGKLMRDSFDIVEEEPEVIETSDSVAESETPVEESPAVEEYECPECGGRITIDMTTCPNCGIGLSFEYEDEE